MSQFSIKQELLCTWLWNNKDKNKPNVDVIIDKIKEIYNYNDNQIAEIRQKLTRTFISLYLRKWNSANRTKETFKIKFKAFLEQRFDVEFLIPITESSEINLSSPTAISSNRTSSTRGRPRLMYEESSDRTKRRRVDEIRSNYTAEELSKAALPNRTKDMKVQSTKKQLVSFIDGTLAMYMDLDLTKSKYETLRAYNQQLLGDKSYPPYQAIASAKENCYPENIQSTEWGASVELQALLDHTTNRLMSTLDNEKLNSLESGELVLYSKWGMDGASGQQTIKQKWCTKNTKKAHPNRDPGNCEESDEEEIVEEEADSDAEEIVEQMPTDETVFIISFVPLEISADHSVLWRNDRPSSIRYCRPIKFEFVKETSVNTSKEYNFYMDGINKLIPTEVNMNEKIFHVSHKMECTMIDGKTCNVLTNQKSSASCNICGAKPSQMNNLELIPELKCSEENYRFGLSTLHCWIRFMECLLHIAYNLDFEKGFARGENKVLKQQRKKKIQTSLKSELSITVDVVKRGYGTTNDGNTARRFFSAPDTVADILGVNQNLVERFANILQVMASGLEIDCDRFEKYANETAELFVELYGWYKMPPSVHKVLIHGSNIMRTVRLPIGCFSEEAQEAGNKVFKTAREHHSRMCSRKFSNEDVLHHLLISSDPVISNLRLKSEKKMKELTNGAKYLLKGTAAGESEEENE